MNYFGNEREVNATVELRSRGITSSKSMLRRIGQIGTRSRCREIRVSKNCSYKLSKPNLHL